MMKEKEQKNGRKIAGFIGKSLLIGVVVFVLLAVPFGISMKPYIEHLRYKEVVVPVTAIITDIDVYEDSDDDEHYELYATYTYDDQIYEDIYWETISADNYEVGDSTTIKIVPDDPTHIMKSDIGSRGFVFVAFIYAIVIAVVIYEESFYKTKANSDILPITEKMIVNDLRPKFLLSIANTLVCAAAGVYGCKIFIPDLVQNTNSADVILIIGLLLFSYSLITVLRIPKKRYSLNIHRCTKKWSESDGDSTSYYTKFENIDATSHGGKVYSRAVEGFQYYVVMDKKGKVREIYDVTAWRPSVEKYNLAAGSRGVAARMCAEMALGVLFMFAFAAIFEFVARQLV